MNNCMLCCESMSDCLHRKVRAIQSVSTKSLLYPLVGGTCTPLVVSVQSLSPRGIVVSCIYLFFPNFSFCSLLFMSPFSVNSVNALQLNFLHFFFFFSCWIGFTFVLTYFSNWIITGSRQYDIISQNLLWNRR